jgi:hypothetical protein
MQIEILKQTSIRGRAVRPGDVVTADPRDGRCLVLLGKAREIDLPQPLPVAIEPTATEVRKPRPRQPSTV